jgi:hypothetical protein
VIVEGSNEQSSTPGAEYVDLSHLLRQNQNMPKVVHPAQEYSDLIPVFLSNTESQVSILFKKHFFVTDFIHKFVGAFPCKPFRAR